jgi:hypothetical protein
MLAQDDRRPGLTFVELRRELLGQLARDPTELVAGGEDLDGVGVVLVVRVALQRQRVPRPDLSRLERLRMVLPGARDADHVQPAFPGRVPA